MIRRKTMSDGFICAEWRVDCLMCFYFHDASSYAVRDPIILLFTVDTPFKP